MTYKPIIFGVKGQELTADESNFFQSARPVGFILFSRNIKNPTQVKALVKSLRTAIGNPYAPILIDQEGGRVARLRKPFWYHPIPASTFGQIAEQNLKDAKTACKLNAFLIAHDLNQLGINVDCAPLVDVPVEEAHDVIGDRAFSDDKRIVTKLAQTMANALMKQGITPIMKHIPGHGRAQSDSHQELPVVVASYKDLFKHDFYPFTKLHNIAWAMTAHVVYNAIDPDHPATQSSKVINEIRDTIGFKGLIVTDCITMQALSGSLVERALSSIEAGCDIVLLSKGELEDMREIIKRMQPLSTQQMALIPNNFAREMRFDKVIQYRNELAKLLGKYDIPNFTLKHDPTEHEL